MDNRHVMKTLKNIPNEWPIRTFVGYLEYIQLKYQYKLSLCDPRTTDTQRQYPLFFTAQIQIPRCGYKDCTNMCADSLAENTWISIKKGFIGYP